MRIAILIPVFNRIETTKSGLKKLKEQLDSFESKEELFVIVVDDNSRDGTSEWIAENMPEIHLLKGNGGLWWSGCINLAANYAIKNLKAEYLLLWNDDIQPLNNYFQELFEVLKNKEVKIVGSMALFESNSTKVHSFGGYFNITNGKKGVYYYNRKPEDIYEEFKKVDWLPGMGTCVHVSVIEKIGYWNAKLFPQYFGDSDFTLRANKAGIDVLVCKKLTIFNDISTTGLNKRMSTITELFTALYSTKSVYDFRRDFLFYKIHGKGITSFYGLFLKYFFYVGGFIKWKVIKIFK